MSKTARDFPPVTSESSAETQRCGGGQHLLHAVVTVVDEIFAYAIFNRHARVLDVRDAANRAEAVAIALRKRLLKI